MDSSEQKLIEELSEQDPGFRRIYNEHRELDEKIDKFERQTYLTAEEEVERRVLKRRKFFKKNQMMNLIQVHLRH